MVKSHLVKRNVKNTWERGRDRTFSPLSLSPFPSCARHIFALLVLMRPTILSESLAQARPILAGGGGGGGGYSKILFCN